MSEDELFRAELSDQVAEKCDYLKSRFSDRVHVMSTSDIDSVLDYLKDAIDQVDY
jgi:hypothetical protein